MGAIPPAAVQVPLEIQLAAVEYDVVVISARLSGLEAARNIHRARLSALVLEAKDHIGGKARSVSNDWNGFIELRAEWINDKNQSEMWPWLKSRALDTVIQRTERLDCVQNKDKSVIHVPYGDTPVSGSTFSQTFFFLANLTVHRNEKSQMASFFEWVAVQSDKWDPSNISSLPNAEELNNMTLEVNCQKYLPGMGGWLANKMTEGLLGVNASEISALFIY
jgi:monoamine oxidase